MLRFVIADMLPYCFNPLAGAAIISLRTRYVFVKKANNLLNNQTKPVLNMIICVRLFQHIVNLLEKFLCFEIAFHHVSLFIVNHVAGNFIQTELFYEFPLEHHSVACNAQ